MIDNLKIAGRKGGDDLKRKKERESLSMTGGRPLAQISENIFSEESRWPYPGGKGGR